MEYNVTITANTYISLGHAESEMEEWVNNARN